MSPVTSRRHHQPKSSTGWNSRSIYTALKEVVHAYLKIYRLERVVPVWSSTLPSHIWARTLRSDGRATLVSTALRNYLSVAKLTDSVEPPQEADHLLTNRRSAEMQPNIYRLSTDSVGTHRPLLGFGAGFDLETDLVPASPLPERHAKSGCALRTVNEVFFKRITFGGRHLAQQTLLSVCALCGFEMIYEKYASTR
jgi:hypothetical protein